MWTCTIDGQTMTDDDLNAGQWEQLYLLVNNGLPHDEQDIRPGHCPTCRNAIVVSTLVLRAEITLELASARVFNMTRGDVVSCFVPADLIPTLPDDDFTPAIV